MKARNEQIKEIHKRRKDTKEVIKNIQILQNYKIDNSFWTELYNYHSLTTYNLAFISNISMLPGVTSDMKIKNCHTSLHHLI